MIFGMSSHPLGDSYLLDTYISIFYEKVDSRTDSHNHRCSDHKNSLGKITKESNLRLWSACSLCFKVRLSAKPFVIHVTSVECGAGGAGGGVTQQTFIRGGSALRSSPLSFYIPFFTKRYPSRIPSIDKWYPFHIPCLELCIRINCCKCTCFKTGIKQQK